MDGRTGILLEDFVQALARTIPGRRQVPFTCLPWRPHIHLLVFVHRVETLAPGIYILVRDATVLDTMRASVAMITACACANSACTRATASS